MTVRPGSSLSINVRTEMAKSSKAVWKTESNIEVPA